MATKIRWKESALAIDPTGKDTKKFKSMPPSISITDGGYSRTFSTSEEVFDPHPEYAASEVGILERSGYLEYFDDAPAEVAAQPKDGEVKIITIESSVPVPRETKKASQPATAPARAAATEVLRDTPKK